MENRWKNQHKNRHKSPWKFGGKIRGKIGGKISGKIGGKIGGNQSAVIGNRIKSYCQSKRNIDINMGFPENIDMGFSEGYKEIWKNVNINEEILVKINIDKIFLRLEYGILNRAIVNLIKVSRVESPKC